MKEVTSALYNLLSHRKAYMLKHRLRSSKLEISMEIYDNITWMDLMPLKVNNINNDINLDLLD